MVDKQIRKKSSEKTALGILGALVVGAAIGSIATYSLYKSQVDSSKAKQKKAISKNDKKETKKAK